MAVRTKESEGPWLSLAKACAVLSVNQSTLRQWADSGRVRSFRTPGGHRRFLRDDLAALLEQHPASRGASALLEETTLRRIRRRLHTDHGSRDSAPGGWMELLNPDGRTRLRLFGRRLLDLSVEYVAQRRRRPALLQEVNAIGEEYGLDLARQRMPLPQVIEAFIFFRNSLFDAARDDAVHSSLRSSDTANLWSQMEQLTDQVLLAMVRAYERSAHASAAPAS